MFDWFVCNGKFAQIVTNHFGLRIRVRFCEIFLVFLGIHLKNSKHNNKIYKSWEQFFSAKRMQKKWKNNKENLKYLDFDSIEILSVVDTNDAANHLGDNDHVSEMGFHGRWFFAYSTNEIQQLKLKENFFSNSN